VTGFSKFNRGLEKYRSNRFLKTQILFKERYMKKCDEVMTNSPVCCLPNDVVATAAKLMKSGNVGSVPVIESEKTRKLVGIVTDRDLVMKVVAEGKDPKTTKVSAVMTTKVVSCKSDDDLLKAMDSMSKNQLRRIPIIDKDGKILGIISQADVATRVDKPKRTAAMVKEISQPKSK
jgi:CBS domain-containing protein